MTHNKDKEPYRFDGRYVTLSFQGRETTISLGMLKHIISCSINHLLSIKCALVEQPFDWLSPTAGEEFKHRRRDIYVTHSAIDDASHLQDWLRDISKPD